MLPAASPQPSLLGGGDPAVDGGALARVRRVALDEDAWVEHLPGWVSGHEALLDHLVRTTAWRTERRLMYDRMVDVPRLVAALPADGPGHPVLEEIRRLLNARYDTTFMNLSLGYYRDGNDSVAWHGDTTARELPQAIVATISLGTPRKFLLRPRSRGSRALAFMLGWGDLIVMGGSCQRTWEHSVPKVAHAWPRMAVMYRPEWKKP
ncbi:MAG TPA: alpha-ketoglutarate-dependent dioxygenase AlkB [Polyangia bacterium]|nr:alpha-ketoglutarate-dependent dioxygenase AlkB [Polyangia bacterium]